MKMIEPPPAITAIMMAILKRSQTTEVVLRATVDVEVAFRVTGRGVGVEGELGIVYMYAKKEDRRNNRVP